MYGQFYQDERFGFILYRNMYIDKNKIFVCYFLADTNPSCVVLVYQLLRYKITSHVTLSPWDALSFNKFVLHKLKGEIRDPI